MGMSLLYEVLEPLPDARTALARARALVAGFGTHADNPYKPELGPVVTAEQFHHALRHFTGGPFSPRDGGPFPPDGLEEFWTVVRDTAALRGGDTYHVEVGLRPEMAELWPMIDAWGLELQVPGWATPPFRQSGEFGCTGAELDTMVAAVGPLGFDVAWDASLRGLPAQKLNGVQLTLNSVWTVQCAEPAPGTHAVHLSIGTRNRDVQDAWLAATALHLGPPLTGW